MSILGCMLVVLRCVRVFLIVVCLGNVVRVLLIFGVVLKKLLVLWYIFFKFFKWVVGRFILVNILKLWLCELKKCLMFLCLFRMLFLVVFLLGLILMYVNWFVVECISKLGVYGFIILLILMSKVVGCVLIKLIVGLFLKCSSVVSFRNDLKYKLFRFFFVVK